LLALEVERRRALQATNAAPALALTPWPVARASLPAGGEVLHAIAAHAGAAPLD
jgi:hypothetical protein